MSSYPGALDSFTHRTDLIDDVMAVDVNELQDAIEAIETELGTDPAGTATDVKTRLAKALSGDGYLQFAAQSALTIASDAITITQNWHTVAPESGTADNLSTINGGADGFVLFLRSVSDANTITVKHNVGNILCFDNTDLVLDYQHKVIVLIKNQSAGKWYAIGGGGGGGGGGAPTDAQYVTLATDSTLTAERVLTAGNGIGLADGGAGGNVTLSVQPDEINIVLHMQVYS